MSERLFVNLHKPEIAPAQIQFVDLKKQYAPLKDDILKGIAKALDGMHLFLGENIQALEREFAEFCGAQYGTGVSDGTTALHLILRALDIGAGDEVITVSHTFIATTEAIMLTGARPVFVDIDPHTFLMDTRQVEEKITAHTKAILPVHLYGQPVDMDVLMDIARRHHLFVVEDACQAHGARYHDFQIGSIGDATAFSFYYSKNLGAYGEGGFISTNNADIHRKVRMLRDHGSETRYHHDLIGFNARPDELQAVILRAKLPHLAVWNLKRRNHAALYNRLLVDTPVLTPEIAPDRKSVFHLYVIRTPQRDALQAYLKEKGVFTGIHYPIPIHLQKATASLGYHPGDLPVTEQVVQEILSLPMYAELEEYEIEYVCNCIQHFFQGHV
jgi:dTDP-4-amino-4,6-dideoxygalactose transaminase